MAAFDGVNHKQKGHEICRCLLPGNIMIYCVTTVQYHLTLSRKDYFKMVRPGTWSSCVEIITRKKENARVGKNDSVLDNELLNKSSWKRLRNLVYV